MPEGLSDFMVEEIRGLSDYAVRRRMLRIAAELDGIWPELTGELRERLLEITERLEFAAIGMEYSPLRSMGEIIDAAIAKSYEARKRWLAGEVSDA